MGYSFSDNGIQVRRESSAICDGQIRNPEEFAGKVKYLYESRHETSRDDILLKDGRILDRYSAPMLGADKKYYGRVWFFRDITERKHLQNSSCNPRKWTR